MRSKANLTYTHIENRRRTHRKSPEAWAKLPALHLFCRSLSHKATCDRLLPGWCHMESKANSTPNKQKQQRQNKQPGSINRAASMWADERGCLYKQHSVLNKVLNRSQHVCIAFFCTTVNRLQHYKGGYLFTLIDQRSLLAYWMK